MCNFVGIGRKKKTYLKESFCKTVFYSINFQKTNQKLTQNLIINKYINGVGMIKIKIKK